MRLRLAAVAVIVLALAGCTAAPEVEPVVVDFDDLAGGTVEVPLDSTLVVNTGHDDLEGMRAELADETIAEFREGANTGEVGYYPVFTPLAVGSTDVAVDAPGGSFHFTLVVEP